MTQTHVTNAESLARQFMETIHGYVKAPIIALGKDKLFKFATYCQTKSFEQVLKVNGLLVSRETIKWDDGECVSG